MKLLLIPIVLLSIMASSCNKNTVAVTASESLATSENSMNSLDWAGRYSGTLPCADCEGMATTLVLYSDLTYRLSLVYLGKNAEKFTSKGSFSWDENGSIVTLKGIENVPHKFKVGENQLIQLDMEGKIIEGASAGKAVLQKWPEALEEQLSSLDGKKFYLTELMGEDVPKQNRAPFITFDIDEMKVSGNNSCNGYFGSFEVAPLNKIHFGQLGSTLMACPDNKDLDRRFMEVLEMADNFYLKDGELILNKAKMAPLARFKAE